MQEETRGVFRRGSRRGYGPFPRPGSELIFKVHQISQGYIDRTRAGFHTARLIWWRAVAVPVPAGSASSLEQPNQLDHNP